MFTIALLFGATSYAQVPPNFKYCAEFMKEARYTQTLPIIGSVFRLDPDRGIVLNKSAAQALEMKTYGGEGIHNFELSPSSAKTKGLYAGTQVVDNGGDPREFQLMDYQVEGFPSAVKVFVYRHVFSFRNGLCLPVKSTRIDGERETVVFDFDKCRAIVSGKSGKNRDLTKESCQAGAVGKIFNEANNDKRFNHGDVSAGGARSSGASVQ